jgi:branched-chain amino acid transport system ATP-binding protein
VILRTVLGKITVLGKVVFEGEEVTQLPAHEIAKRGLILCPERGRPFREMTVTENLETGAYLCRDKALTKENLNKVYYLFPVLKERENQIAGTLSGGERTQLSIARALMSQAKCLLIDEPSVGLAPLIKEVVFGRIREVHGMGITVLLTEQDVSFAFDLSSRNYVLSRGKVVAEGTGADLLADELIRKTYLGLLGNGLIWILCSVRNRTLFRRERMSLLLGSWSLLPKSATGKKPFPKSL